MSFRKNTTIEDAKKVLNLFVIYGELKRKQIVYYSEFSDRKVRNLIKYIRSELLPSVRGETLIYNTSSRFYEYTNDPENIEMYKRYLTSYINELCSDLRALDKAGVKGQIKMEI